MHGETLRPGGKGVNVSLVCAALGLSTRALGFIAGGTGALFASLLAETGVEYDFCRLGRGMTRINVKVCAREQTELNGAGPDIPADALEKLAASLDTLGGGDWLVLSGSVPSGVPTDIYARLLDRVRANGVHTLVDASDDALKNALPCAPDLIQPNLEELDALVGGAPRTPAGIAACARELQAAGAKDILVSSAWTARCWFPPPGTRSTCRRRRSRSCSRSVRAIPWPRAGCTRGSTALPGRKRSAMRWPRDARPCSPNGCPTGLRWKARWPGPAQRRSSDRFLQNRLWKRAHGLTGRALSAIIMPCRHGGTGRRRGLKIPR